MTKWFRLNGIRIGKLFWKATGMLAVMALLLYAADDVKMKLTDSAGVSTFAVQDSTGASVFRINSDGNVTLGAWQGTNIAIANGGTGQSTATAAFDALSPTATKGDIIVDNGTNNIRLAVGANNQVLTADSTQASGVKWAVPYLTNLNSKLGADVTMVTAGTWYDGPSISLGAGTWLVTVQITMGFTAATAHYSCARITNSAATTYYASGQQRPVATNPAIGTITMSTIVTLGATTTIKVQGVSNTANCLMRAASSYAGGNTATQITAVQIQ